MATAPTSAQAAATNRVHAEANATTLPGETEAERESITMSMTYPGGDRKTRQLRFTELGPRDDLECRKETGFPVQGFFSSGAQIGTDGALVLWWVAGRKSGVVGETFNSLLDLFPTWEAMAAADIDVEVEETQAPLV
jgi:hypothetical protein